MLLGSEYSINIKEYVYLFFYINTLESNKKSEISNSVLKYLFT